MSTIQQKMWPWQLKKRQQSVGEMILDKVKRLFILGVCIGLPVGLISLFPFVDQFSNNLLGTDWGLVVSAIVKGLLLIVVVLSGVAYATLAERRFAGLIQRRKGPNRVGWFGFLQPAADGLKFLFKEDMIPDNVHKPLYIISPMVILIPAITVLAIIPWGPGEAGTNPYQIAPVNVGVLLIFAITSLGVYGIALGGWASYSKWSLLGGLRASAQMISYEVALALSVTGVFVLAGTLDPVVIVQKQIEGAPLLGFLPPWGIFTQFLGFIAFLVVIFAETNRLPFDFAEAEQELVGGYHTEYSSMKFALFMLSEYANMIVGSAVLAILFLGGWHVPGLELLSLPEIVANAIQIFALFLKIFLVMFLFIWVRWTLPRFRYDQLMKLGWLGLLPLALLNVILTVIWVALTSQTAN
jgi:NADH-quinone oxidoreductase subunit H